MRNGTFCRIFHIDCRGHTQIDVLKADVMSCEIGRASQARLMNERKGEFFRLARVIASGGRAGLNLDCLSPGAGSLKS